MVFLDPVLSHLSLRGHFVGYQKSIRMPFVSRACHREAPQDELWCLVKSSTKKSSAELVCRSIQLVQNVFVCRSNQLVKLVRILSGILGIISELRNAAGLPATANPPDQSKVPEVKQPSQATQPTQPAQPLQPRQPGRVTAVPVPGTPDFGPGVPRTPPGILRRGILRTPGTPPMPAIVPGTPPLHVAHWEAPRTPPLVATWPGQWSPPMRPRPASPVADIDPLPGFSNGYNGYSPPMRPRPAPTVDIESRTPAAPPPARVTAAPPPARVTAAPQPARVTAAPPPARVTAAPQPARVKTKRGKKPGKKEREQERRIAASRAPPAPPAQPSGTKRKSTNTNIPSQPSSSSSPLTKTFWLKMLASEQWLRSLNRKARSLESSCQVRIYIPDESGRYSSTSVEFSCWPF